MRKVLIILIGILILAVLNYSIYTRERLVSSSESVFLELAPVDPRSIMQGDYMVLRFDIASKVSAEADAKGAKNGFVVLRKDERGVGKFSRLSEDEPLAENEVRMLYRKRHKTIKFATNAFFFQEGKGPLFDEAKFGEFKVAENGDSILVGMRDKDLKQLGEVTEPLLD
ncbi:hypothetical protein EOL70_14845 [Leucothrix sargassi]|nr:hypothetical protein EOL70_14845 [Leucothrix sargassi]